MNTEDADLRSINAEVKLITQQLFATFTLLASTEAETNHKKRKRKRGDFLERRDILVDCLKESKNARKAILKYRYLCIRWQQPQNLVTSRPLGFLHSVKHFELSCTLQMAVMEVDVCFSGLCNLFGHCTLPYNIATHPMVHHFRCLTHQRHSPKLYKPEICVPVSKPFLCGENPYQFANIAGKISHSAI